MNSARASHPVVKDIFLPESATVLDVQQMTEMEIFLRVQMDNPTDHSYMPGQFMEVSVAGIGEAPISISSSPSRMPQSTFEMVIRKVGNVSAALHRLQVGDKIGIRGPFGTTFPVLEEMKGRDLLFLCGGIGLVPVRSAIDYVLDHRHDYGAVNILVGTRTPKDRLFIADLQVWGARQDVTLLETVDISDSYGEDWNGPVGVITTLIPQLKLKAERTTAIVCGPPIMYRFVLMELRKLQLPNNHIFLSLERQMKCGVGKCGHCQINGMYACQQGPVFKFSDIEGTREAI